MIKRILTAAVMLVVLFGFLLGLRQIHVAFVAGIIAVLSVMAAYEMCSALKKADYNPMKLLVLCSAFLASFAAYFLNYFGILIVLVLSTVCAATIFTFKHNYELKDFFATIAILLYPIAPVSLLIVMNNEVYGLYAILLTIIVPIMTDTMAYFTGMLLGKTKLCPTISPKKTVAGAVGGVIGGIIGALLIFLAFDIGNIFGSFNNVTAVSVSDNIAVSIIAYIALGIIAAPMCEIGDLAASWIKRKAGIKDYGNIFPGHGGIMDRLDSIIFMIPITIVFTSLVMHTIQISGI